MTNTNYLVQGVVFTMPLFVLHLLMDALVYLQFGFESDFTFSYVIHTYPQIVLAIFLFVYVSNRYSSTKLMQSVYVITATLASCYLIYFSVHVETFGAMKHTPGLVILWVYCAVQMDIIPLLSSLLVPVVYYFKDSVINMNNVRIDL
jgi:hypothetical protein